MKYHTKLQVYPIQKKYLPPPVLRDMAHLRFRTTQTASIMRVRDGMMREWHDWFEVGSFSSPCFFLPQSSSYHL